MNEDQCSKCTKELDYDHTHPLAVDKWDPVSHSYRIYGTYCSRACLILGFAESNED